MKQSEMNEKEQNIYENLERQIQNVFKHSHECAFKTRERYSEGMNSFAAFLAVEYRKMNILKVSNNHIKAYVDHMQERGYSKSYVTTNLSAVRYFYDKALGGKLIINSNRFLGANHRTVNDRIGVNRAISEEDFKSLLAKASAEGRQDYFFIIKVAGHLGLRIHEVFSMRKSQIKKALVEGSIFVKGKGGVIRSIPLNDEDKILLIEVISSKYGDSDRVFVKKDEKTHLKIKALQGFIADSRENEPGKYKYTFHSLRHRFAQRLYADLFKKGLSEKECRLIVSNRLGHGRDEVTRIYTEERI